VDPPELVVGHRDQRVAGPHPERALILPSRAREAGRDSHQQHPLAVVIVLLDGNSMSELLEEPRLGATGFGECARADDLAGSAVADSEHEASAALVGKRNAVLDQILEMKAACGRFKLDVCAFGAVEQCLELGGRRHRSDSL
jgi:hypothetical protein